MEQQHAKTSKPGQAPISPEGDEDWYAGTLIRLVIVGARTSAQLTSGEAMPDLADFATTPEHLAQVTSLPFKHDELDADKVIDRILRQAGWRPYSFLKRTGTLRIPLVTGGGRLLMIER